MLFNPADNRIPVPTLLKRFAVIYMPVVIVFSAILFASIRLDKQRVIEKTTMLENHRIAIAKASVIMDLSAVDTDLQVIADMPLLHKYLDNDSPTLRSELENLFLVLAQKAKRYDQIRYLDSHGQEVIRINFHNGKPVVVPSAQLQNKSGRYYFHDTISLNREEVFVSPLDLNIEHNRLDIPYKPMIRFGAPVFDSTGHKKGVILLNYLGDELLHHFHEVIGYGSQRGMLLNSDGYWLSDTLRENEWGFMLGKHERTFGHDFAIAWHTISSSGSGALLTDQGLFVYATVYPLLSNQRSSTGSNLPTAPSQYKIGATNYSWKIVSFVPRDTLFSSAFYNRLNGQILFGIIYLLLGLASFSIAYFTLFRNQVQTELASSKSRYDELVRSIPVGIYILHRHLDGAMTFTYVSKIFCRILNLNEDHILDNANVVFDIIHPDDLRSLTHPAMAEATSLKHYVWEGRCFVRGETRWIQFASELSPLLEDGRLWNGVISDITEKKRLEMELEYQASIDLLTNINNRRHFFELAEKEMARAKRHDQAFALLMLDVDHFKLVNDTFGHNAGDLVLQKLSEICAQALREIDIIGRIGGEEFAILLPETEMLEAFAVAERLRLAVANTLVTLDQGNATHFTVSIGLAGISTTDVSINDILKRADTALYAAKNSGRNRVCSE